MRTPQRRCARGPTPACVALSLVASLAGNAQAQGADACQPVWDATIKLSGTPNHQYVVKRAGAKSQTVELVNTGFKRYVMMEGRWTASNLTPQQWLQQEKQNIKNATDNRCSVLRDETLNGDLATVYAAHSKNVGGASDAQLWISKRTGLLLKMEVDLAFDGARETEHLSTRIVYEGVQAPVGPKAK